MNRRNLLIVLILLALLVVPVSADWLDGWSCRKSHVISNADAELTNYQILFTVHRSDDTDSGEDVYIGSSGCESDYDDIRFTSSDGTTLLDYWIEASDENTATIWLEVPTLTAEDDTSIYLYYGNASATAVSDGEDTFDFFDDFPGSAIDTDKWTVENTASITAGILDCGGSGSIDKVVSKTAFSPGSHIYRSKSKVSSYTVRNWWGFRGTGATCRAMYYTDANGDDQHAALTSKSGGTNMHSIGTSYGTNYHTWEVRLESTSSVKFYIDDSFVYTSTTYCPTEDMYVDIAGWDAHVYTDWVLVRQYAATEPTHGVWGEEEYEITADFSSVPTSGYVPLTVYFTDNSTSTGDEPVIIDIWLWNFGDGTSSSDKNPVHQYTTSGYKTPVLSVQNETYGTIDSIYKTDYINVLIDSSAPVADFVATPLCEDVGENIYFIDYSTGGGLYAWNWSFGDGNYSELRNPVHSYAANGTYDITLNVWGANGTDSKTKTGYITIPCGAPTPTPTPTGTPPTQLPTTGGRISPFGFVVLACIDMGVILYGFIDNENRNYMHVFAFIIGTIISFLLGMFLITGYVSEEFVVTAAEVTVNSSVLSTYETQLVPVSDAGFGFLFIFIGVLMLVYSVLASLEAMREIMGGNRT